MRNLPFELRIPVIQAPMAGANITTPQMVAAVSKAGGMGSLAGGYVSAADTERQIRAVRELTDLPFAINLFAPSSRRAGPGDVARQLQLLAPIHQELGIDPPSLAEPLDSFDEQVEVILEARLPVVSFTFGVLPPAAMDRLHAKGAYLIGTATTVHEAKQLEAAGADAIVAQGAEAGAHRGTFTVPPAPALVGTIALVPQIVDAVRIPVVASGGIMDGRGVVAALALGASAVQMGTAFLTTDECGASAVYKQAVLDAADDSTSLTRAFSGRWARGIRNRFMELSESSEPLDYPRQNSLTGPMRAAAGRQGNRDYLSLYAGQGAKLARRLPVATLMAALQREIHDALKGVSSFPV